MKSTIRIVAVILNFGIIALILGMVLHEALELDNINTYVFMGAAMVTPLINILGLIGKPYVINPLIALAVNSLVLAVFTCIILLVVIWPMGSKPRGTEIGYIFSLYAALLVTEVSHILRIKITQKIRSVQGGGS